MTTGEKFILDALTNLSKSMSRIADELHRIGEVITYDHRKSVSEARKAKFQKSGIINENKSSVDSRDKNLSDKSPLENIHNVLNGKYLSPSTDKTKVI